MRRVQVFVLVAAAVVMLGTALFPPFAAMDLRSDGRIHGALGHHALWRPPSSEQAYRAIVPGAGSAPAPAPERVADVRVFLNKVRLGVELTGTFLATGALLLLLRRASAGASRSPSDCRRRS